jgi:hypothetical protein
MQTELGDDSACSNRRGSSRKRQPECRQPHREQQRSRAREADQALTRVERVHVIVDALRVSASENVHAVRRHQVARVAGAGEGDLR